MDRFIRLGLRKKYFKNNENGKPLALSDWYLSFEVFKCLEKDEGLSLYILPGDWTEAEIDKLHKCKLAPQSQELKWFFELHEDDLFQCGLTKPKYKEDECDPIYGKFHYEVTCLNDEQAICLRDKVLARIRQLGGPLRSFSKK